MIIDIHDVINDTCDTSYSAGSESVRYDKHVRRNGAQKREQKQKGIKPYSFENFFSRRLIIRSIIHRA